MAWFSCKLSEVKSGKKTLNVGDVTIDRAIGSDWSPDWISDLTGEQSARDFIDAVEALGEVDKIRLTINSPGGDVASGIRIFNYLKNHPANVEIRVEGMAASIASVIMMAGDSRVMGVGSVVMVHNPMTFAGGYYNESELREMADAMAVIKSAIVDAYVAGTGRDADEISAMMDEGDSYFDAADAMEWGFATATDETIRAVATAEDMAPFAQQMKVAAKAKELEAENSVLAGSMLDLEAAHKAEVEKLEREKVETELALATAQVAIDGLTETLDAYTNPTPATAEQVIEWAEEFGVENFAVQIAKQKLTPDVAKQRLELAAEMSVIATAAGINAETLVNNLDNVALLVRAAVAEAMAAGQSDVANQVSPTAGGNSRTPDSRRAFAQLNRK